MSSDDGHNKNDLVAGMSEEVATAIRDAVAKHEGGIVTKWVSVIETMDDTGARGVWHLSDESVPDFEIAEMLHTAWMNLERERTVHLLLAHLNHDE